MHREPRILEAEAQVGKWLDCFKGTCTTPVCEKWHPPKCLFYKSENGCQLGDKCSYANCQVDEQPSKKFVIKVTQQQWENWRIHDNWVANLRIWSRRSLHRFCGRAWTCWKPIRCVRFTKTMVRHAYIRDQNPSLGVICPGDPHQRNPNTPKFEDWSQEVTERQERYAREAAWKMARSILKLKDKNKAAFFSPSENRCLPAPSTLNQRKENLLWIPVRRCIWSAKRIWFRWIGNRDDVEKSNDSHNSQWWSANAWRGNCVCQRIGCILDTESPRGYASSSIAGKALRWRRILLWMDQWSNPHLIENGIRIQCSTENFVPIVVLGLSTSSSSSLLSSTSMTPSKEVDHSDHHPAIVSS